MPAIQSCGFSTPHTFDVSGKRGGLSFDDQGASRPVTETWWYISIQDGWRILLKPLI
jgi:hypothetical protein